MPLTGQRQTAISATLGIPDARRPRRRRREHAAYERIYLSSLVPRTYLCTRLLETLGNGFFASPSSGRCPPKAEESQRRFHEFQRRDFKRSCLRPSPSGPLGHLPRLRGMTDNKPRLECQYAAVNALCERAWASRSRPGWRRRNPPADAALALGVLDQGVEREAEHRVRLPGPIEGRAAISLSNRSLVDFAHLLVGLQRRRSRRLNAFPP